METEAYFENFEDIINEEDCEESMVNQSLRKDSSVNVTAIPN